MKRKRKPSGQALAVLAALVERPRGWHHGYDLSNKTNLKSGTLYPILMRLSDRGLLESKWETDVQESRPPRHMYKMNAQGLAYAREQLSDCLPKGTSLRRRDAVYE